MLLRQMSLVFAGLIFSGCALADCAGASAAYVQKQFSDAEKFETGGDLRKALSAYVHAQEYVCDGNKVEPAAAKKAAALAKRLAPNLEKEGKLQDAFEVYEAGGYFREADRIMQALLDKHPDDHGLYDQALQHFGNRQLPAFQQNNRVRIANTGDYRADADYYKKLQARPAASVDRLLKREQDVLADDFLRDMMQLDGKINEAASNPAMLMQLQQEQTRLHAKWGGDRFEDSLRILRDASVWVSRIPDQKAREQGESKVHGRRISRGDQLLSAYSSSPSMLEHALDYYREAQAGDKTANLQSAARKLGETAMQKNRYMAAAGYFDLAGEDEKAEAARARYNEQGMQNFDMNTYMQEMSRQARHLQNSPEAMQQMQLMQQQMEAVMKNMNPPQ